MRLKCLPRSVSHCSLLSTTVQGHMAVVLSPRISQSVAVSQQRQVWPARPARPTTGQPRQARQPGPPGHSGHDQPGQPGSPPRQPGRPGQGPKTLQRRLQLRPLSPYNPVYGQIYSYAPFLFHSIRLDRAKLGPQMYSYAPFRAKSIRMLRFCFIAYG